VLVTTTVPARERELHERLDPAGLTVATSHPDLGHPTGPVWLTHTTCGWSRSTSCPKRTNSTPADCQRGAWRGVP
jgi:hypothetical protein